MSYNTTNPLSETWQRFFQDFSQQRARCGTELQDSHSATKYRDLSSEACEFMTLYEMSPFMYLSTWYS